MFMTSFTFPNLSYSDNVQRSAGVASYLQSAARGGKKNVQGFIDGSAGKNDRRAKLL